MLVPLPDVLEPGTIVAHRGNRVAERENTVAAFRSAAAAGAAGVELDVRRTRDNHFVIHHDAVIDGIGAIIDKPLDELRAAAPWLPTLPEALEACSGMWVNVEIKNAEDDADWDPERSVARSIRSHLDPEGIIVSSFDWESVQLAKAGGFTTAYLTTEAPLPAIARAAEAGHRAINPHFSLLAGPDAGAVVAAAEDQGVWVLTWTVNDTGEAVRLRDAGVHGIITDDPALLSATLG